MSGGTQSPKVQNFLTLSQSNTHKQNKCQQDHVVAEVILKNNDSVYNQCLVSIRGIQSPTSMGSPSVHGLLIGLGVAVAKTLEKEGQKKRRGPASHEKQHVAG